MNIEDLVVDELDAQFEKLRTKGLSPEEEKATVSNIAVLIDEKIKLEQQRADCVDKKKQSKHMWWELVIKYGLEAVGLVASYVFMRWGLKQTFKFEETGTITSTAGRGIWNMLLRKKK